MKINKIFALAAAFVLLLGSCGKESPFDPNGEDGTGRLLKKAIYVELLSDEKVVRSSDGISLGDFNVAIIKDGEESPYVTYKYSEMPEVVTLPEGTYTIHATYGDDVESGIDTPFYEGDSQSFRVAADEITDNVGNVVCRLKNIKVSVLFSDRLVSNMSDDSYVEVRIGDGTSVSLHRLNELNGNAAYFRYVEGEPLRLTFHGIVEGWETHETKIYQEVANGTHYKITFDLRSSTPDNTGSIEGTIRVNATLTSIDVERNVPMADDELLDENERPKEGPGGSGNDDPKGVAPTITAEAPIDLDAVNDVVDGLNVVLQIHSETGISTFEVDILSETLTPAELQGVGLDSHLDLVNPGQFEEALAGLGFPVNVGGKKDVTFNISDFMPLLSVLGPANHSFVLTVTDAGGKTVKTLKLRTL